MRASLDGISYNFSGRIPQNAERSYQFLLLRTLLGVIAIDRGSAKIKLNVDHSVFPGVPQLLSPAAAVSKFMREYGVAGGIQRFLRLTTSDNRTFYQNLLAEFANFHIETQKGSHASAFIYLYRILERMSFSVPLLYCSTSRDYAGTFNDLRAMFGPDSDKSGEHGFFKKFLSQGRIIERDILDSSYALDFSAAADNRNRYYSQIIRHSDKFLNGDEATCHLEIKFVDVPDLIRNVRNRFFHARTGDGQRNISLVEIHDAHGLFGCLNGVFLNFVALIVLHSLSHKYA